MQGTEQQPKNDQFSLAGCQRLVPSKGIFPVGETKIDEVSGHFEISPTFFEVVVVVIFMLKFFRLACLQT